MIMFALLMVLGVGLVLLLFVAATGAASKRTSRSTRVSTSLKPAVIQTKWLEIKDSQTTPGGLKNSLIETDKLLDYVLKGKGFAGVTMAERLKRAEPRLSDKNAVWRAHKLRNMLAHEIDHDLVVPQVKAAIASLAKAIGDLGVKL